MAKLLTLSALLSTLLPFSVAVGWTGCRLPSTYLERLGPSSQSYWTDSMQHVAEGVDFSNLPGGLLSCKAGLMTCASVKIALVPVVGLNVNVLLNTVVRCKLLSIDVELHVSLYVQVRLLVRDVVLAVDGCAVVDARVALSPLLLSLDVSLLVDPISLLLSGPGCQRARTVCHDLNYVFDLPVGLPTFPPGCTSVLQRHRPLIGSQDIVFRCTTTVNCGGTEYHFGTDPGLVLPIPGIADGITYYFTLKELNDLIMLCRTRQWFDTSITPVAVTTSNIIVHVPGGGFPENLPVVVKITCTEIRVVLTPDRATLHCNFWIEIGCEGFPLLLRLNLRLTLRLRLRIDCSRRLMLLSVDENISDWQLSDLCVDRRCAPQLSELDMVLGLRSLILGWIQAQLLIGFPWITFNAFGCGTCSEVLWIQDTCYWSCNMRYPVL